MRTLGIVVVLALLVSACAPAVTRPGPRTAEPPVRRVPSPKQATRSSPEKPPAPPPPVATRADDGPLTAKIDAATPSGRSAALRMIEQGRHELQKGDAARAIELFERAVALDGSVPYAYYFLAEAHAQANHPALAARFLDRAEQKLAGEPYWLSEVFCLRGRLLSDAGKSADAEAAYRRALQAWPGNRAAAEALTAAARRGKESP